MHISLSPLRSDETLAISRAGDTVTVNGEPFDFTALPDGATLPREAINSDWFAGPVERIDGLLHIKLALPHGANAPDETRFPAPITLTQNGPVQLPPHDAAEEEE